eukprot:SAG22_NODE_2972_length_2058_cov_4.972435_1_plen_34_part_10
MDGGAELGEWGSAVFGQAVLVNDPRLKIDTACVH